MKKKKKCLADKLIELEELEEARKRFEVDQTEEKRKQKEKVITMGKLFGVNNKGREDEAQRETIVAFKEKAINGKKSPTTIKLYITNYSDPFLPNPPSRKFQLKKEYFEYTLKLIQPFSCNLCLLPIGFTGTIGFFCTGIFSSLLPGSLK